MTILPLGRQGFRLIGPPEQLDPLAAAAIEEVPPEGASGAEAVPLAPVRRRRRLVASVSLSVWGSIVVVLLLLALIAPWAAPYGSTTPDYTRPLAPMLAPEHLFGTDQFGRDLLSRTLFGARPLIVASLGSVALALVVGFAIGAVAGYLGGIFEAVSMRIVDLLLSVPLILLALILATGLGSGLRNLVIAIGVSQTPIFARLVRALVRRELQREYALAARVAGFGPTTVALRELTPNLIGPVIVQATATVGVAAGYAAALSYLGVGIEPPMADWGLMAREGQEFITRAPHLAIVPAAAITIFVVAWNFVGDSLRDLFDRADRGTG